MSEQECSSLQGLFSQPYAGAGTTASPAGCNTARSQIGFSGDPCWDKGIKAGRGKYEGLAGGGGAAWYSWGHQGVRCKLATPGGGGGHIM